MKLPPANNPSTQSNMQQQQQQMMINSVNTCYPAPGQAYTLIDSQNNIYALTNSLGGLSINTPVPQPPQQQQHHQKQHQQQNAQYSAPGQPQQENYGLYVSPKPYTVTNSHLASPVPPVSVNPANFPQQQQQMYPTASYYNAIPYNVPLNQTPCVYTTSSQACVMQIY